MLPDKKSYFLVFSLLMTVLIIHSLYSQVTARDNFGLADGMLNMQISEQSFLLPTASPPPPVVAEKLEVVVTAYSSTPEETDDTPFITASGEIVREGIVANNMLGFGTRVRFPELFGDKVFEVQDRMHWRKGDYQLDIWFPNKEEALAFGAKTTKIEILSD